MHRAALANMKSAVGVARDWREQLGARLVAADAAVAHIKSGDRVCLSMAQATPFTLCAALAGRLVEIDNVVVNHGGAAMNWDLPGLGERFHLESFFLTVFDRGLYARGAADFTPIQYYRAGHLPPSLDNFNVHLMTVSPPDGGGYCNFGDAQVMSKLLARNADLVIAEVDPRSIRVGGDNSIHISEIDYFVERAIILPDFVLPQLGEDEARTIATACELVAKRMIPDRATIQVGVGSMSGELCAHLLGHHDLGMQTEVIPLHTVPLVKAGVLTGKYKKLFPGIVVGAAFAPLTPREELDYADGHPAFALYDFNLTNDIRLIAQEEGIIAVNNALAVDVTGQVNGESIGPAMHTGSGGQTAFVIAASMAGGKAITVTPSTSIVNGQRVSRIVAALPPGSVVTAPRAFVHHVVTEYGIANLKGKSIRGRIDELVSVAHPDFRAELRAEARRLYRV